MLLALVRSVSSPSLKQNEKKESRTVGVGKPATRAFGHVIFLCVFNVKVNLSQATILCVAIHRHSVLIEFLSIYF